MGVGLQIPNGLSFEDWERTGRQLAHIVDSSAWWLGDWLVFGKKNYSDRYERAIRAVGLRYQTLRNYAWVARRFDLKRRRPKLSFQHHAEVASLPLTDQEWLLDKAERAKWTTKQLRNAIQNVRNGETEDSKPPTSIDGRIEVPNNRMKIWQRAANHSGVEFQNWVLETLDRAAEDVLQEDAMTGS
ncbi:LmbU family transcriptional regulator [Kutzneria buriramensis]|uniref:Uncharacterized protein n=1 Tax=Kutzneria buriramensis TaxID=1045776 RepID=A0A3E0HKB5_9PSEU|nr:LmbU family transcriptional regulator [Kutzneria buriramensis]REH46913.1 hypothetical protein BCF44_10677 [Kutzneria buriramensis]